MALPSAIVCFMNGRMKKYIAKILSIVLLLSLAACDQGSSVDERVAQARKRNDGPAIWKVSDPNSTLYLFGTVHLLPDDADWMRRDLQAAFDEVGTVFFEIPDGDKANLEASILQRRHGIYQSGTRLSNYLDPITTKHLTAAAYNVNIAPEKLEIFKPWIVADMLSVAAAQEAGLFAKNSADTALRAQAKQARKVIKALDDMQTYIEAVALQPDWVQIQSLEATVKNFDTLGADFKTVNAAWRVGNLGMLVKDMMVPAKERSPEMFDALFTQRNAKWTKTLDSFLQGDDSALVVVGVGHMLGEDGLPARLRELGYDVERWRRFDLPN